MPPLTSTVPALVSGRLKERVPVVTDLRRTAPAWLSKFHAPLTLKTWLFLKSHSPPERLVRVLPVPERIR